MNYFLCSGLIINELLNNLPKIKISKPFKSGYATDNDYYVALFDFTEVELYLNEERNGEYDFWCRECVPGSMDVSKITIKNIKAIGLFSEIENKLNLTTERNIAMCIYNLSEKYNCNPIEFINKITK